MKKFTDFLVRNALLVLLLFLALVLAGYRSFVNVPVDAFPDITPKQVVIYTESPGNSAEDIEKIVTYPIESAMAGLAGVKKIVSTSMFGLSYVAIFFEENYDIYFLRQLVAERLSRVDIPKGWGKPVLGPNTTGLGQVFWYVLEDKDSRYDLKYLRELQEYLVSPMLKSIEGVEEVVTWGGFEKRYQILIDTKRLQALEVTFSDLIDALAASNMTVGGQYLRQNGERYLIRATSLFEDLEDIESIVVKSEGPSSVTVGDLATVSEAAAPRFGAVSLNGSERVFAMVLQRSGTNAAKVVESIKERIAQIESALPSGVTIRPIYDRSQITQKAIDTMSSALAMGALLVALILFLFLFEIRSALIVIISLPISLAVAFLLMERFGISANLMSLSGLAIAVGMIVDAAIVLVENSFRLMQQRRDLSKIELISISVSEVARPIIFAVLIVSAVFLPLLMLDGLAGKLYRPMAVNIVFAMAGSLIVALFLVPVLAYLFLKPDVSGASPLIGWLKRIYLPLLNFSISHGRIIVAIITVVFLGGVWKLTHLGREFMPHLNEESVMYRVIAIPGTSLEMNLKSAQEIERFILKEYPQRVEFVLSMIGRSEKGETAQANYMEILVGLKDFKGIDPFFKNLTDTLQERFEYLKFVPTQPIAMRVEELLEGVRSELAIKIFGENQSVMAKIAKEITERIENIKGLSMIESEAQLGQTSIVIRPDTLALARYGLTPGDIMELVRYGLGEEPVTHKIEGVKRFGVSLKIKGAKEDIEALKSVTIRSKSGSVVDLDEVCKIDLIEGPAFIKRENLSRYMVISFDLKERDIASFVKEAQDRISKEIELPTGYYLEWAGDFKNMEQATRKLLFIVPLTIAAVFVLLYSAFGSFSKALLIISGVPLGLIGGIAAVLWSGIYLSVSALIGFIVVFAISVLNSIVLVSFMDQLRQRNRGDDLQKVVKEAALLRLRPVLMTAFTTFLGVLPLLFISGVGSEIQYPLAVVVSGGIISSTFLTLLVMPSLYYMLYKNKGV